MILFGSTEGYGATISVHCYMAPRYSDTTLPLSEVTPYQPWLHVQYKGALCPRGAAI